MQYRLSIPAPRKSVCGVLLWNPSSFQRSSGRAIGCAVTHGLVVGAWCDLLVALAKYALPPLEDEDDDDTHPFVWVWPFEFDAPPFVWVWPSPLELLSSPSPSSRHSSFRSSTSLAFSLVESRSD